MMLVILALLCALFITGINGFYMDPKDIVPAAYCGIPPFPQSILPIPQLGPDARKLKLKPLDHHVYFRHGDRSSISNGCFQTVPEFRDRVWTECPNPVYAFHTGLVHREHGTTERENYRYSVQPYPNKNVLDGNCHSGGLTQKGAMMSYNNGMRYARYLNQTQPTVVTPGQFRTRSTDYHRTRETGQSFMTGVYDQLPSMFPAPTEFTPQRHVPTFTWVEGKVDSLAMNDNMCSTAAYLKKAYAAPAWKEYEEKIYSPLQQKVREAVNDPNADVYDNLDCIKTMFCHQNAIPAGLEPLHAEMEAAMLNYYIQSFQFDHAKANRYYTGVWAADLISLLAPALKPETYNERTFNINSSHDSNIQAMMSFLNWGNRQWPPYSALLQIELYKDSKVTYVRFIYDAVVVIPTFCTAQAQELCLLTDFVSFLSTALPIDGECQGIPRTFMNGFKTAMQGTETLLPPKVNQLVQQFVTKMTEIYTADETPDAPVTDNQEELKQRSHLENWGIFQKKW